MAADSVSHSEIFDETHSLSERLDLMDSLIENALNANGSVYSVYMHLEFQVDVEAELNYWEFNQGDHVLLTDVVNGDPGIYSILIDSGQYLELVAPLAELGTGVILAKYHTTASTVPPWSVTGPFTYSIFDGDNLTPIAGPAIGRTSAGFVDQDPEDYTIGFVRNDGRAVYVAWDGITSIELPDSCSQEGQPFLIAFDQAPAVEPTWSFRGENDPGVEWIGPQPWGGPDGNIWIHMFPSPFTSGWTAHWLVPSGGYGPIKRNEGGSVADVSNAGAYSTVTINTNDYDDGFNIIFPPKDHPQRFTLVLYRTNGVVGDGNSFNFVYPDESSLYINWSNIDYENYVTVIDCVPVEFGWGAPAWILTGFGAPYND